jgi:hypothetical protein
MKYLSIQTILLLLSVLFLYYLLNQNYFLPQDNVGNLNLIYFALFLVISTILIESFVSLLIYLVERIFIYKKTETTIGFMPPIKNSLTWGLIISFSFTVALLLNIFHIISLPWGIAIAFVLIIAKIAFK